MVKKKACKKCKSLLHEAPFFDDIWTGKNGKDMPNWVKKSIEKEV